MSGELFISKNSTEKYQCLYLILDYYTTDLFDYILIQEKLEIKIVI